MPTTQMNTRINEELKSAGDATLESIGYTPSRAVRALWGFVARNKHDAEVVEALLHQLEGENTSEDDERKRKVQLAESGPHNFERFVAEMGIPEMLTFSAPDLSAAEIREQKALERAAQKGWIDG